MKEGKRLCPDCNEEFEWYHQNILRQRRSDSGYKVYKIPEGKSKSISYSGPDENGNMNVIVHCYHCDSKNEFIVKE